MELVEGTAREARHNSNFILFSFLRESTAILSELIDSSFCPSAYERLSDCGQSFFNYTEQNGLSCAGWAVLVTGRGFVVQIHSYSTGMKGTYLDEFDEVPKPIRQ